MKKLRQNNDKATTELDQETIDISPSDERTKAMFRMYLKGASVREIACEFGISETTVYRAARKGKWPSFKTRLEQRHYNKIIAEVASDLDQETELEEAFKKSRVQRLPSGEGYLDVNVIQPEGVKHFGVLSPAPGIEILRIDGQLTIRRHFSKKEMEEVKRKLIQKKP